jgi:hypothetical protein
MIIKLPYRNESVLRGKLLNVREASGKALLENAEIQAIKQIMGLQQGNDDGESRDGERLGRVTFGEDEGALVPVAGAGVVGVFGASSLRQVPQPMLTLRNPFFVRSNRSLSASPVLSAWSCLNLAQLTMLSITPDAATVSQYETQKRDMSEHDPHDEKVWVKVRPLGAVPEEG